MRILITGASGLIGSRLSQHLADRGHSLRLGTRRAVLIGPPGHNSVQIDWNDQATLDAACRGMDAVIHSAGMNAKDAAADPVEALNANGIGSARLAAAAHRAGVRRLLYFSTAHVYANPLTGTITEDDYPRNLHPYASSHLAAEYALQWAGQDGGPAVLVLRLSNAFGAPLSAQTDCWGLLANDLCRQIMEYGRMRLVSRGMQWRDFIPLTAVSDVVAQLIEADAELYGTSALNLGGRAMRVIEMAQLIQTRAGVLFGQAPPLERPSGQRAAEATPLHYCSDRLATLITMPAMDIEGELDALLRYCAAHFAIPGRT